jgi:hypothetical protein
MRATFQQILSLAAAMAAVVTLVPSCVPKEEKKEEAKAPPPPPPPPPEPARSKLKVTPGAAYTLVATESSKCLQFVGAGNVEGAHTEIQSCKSTPAQQFKLQPLPGNYYKIVNLASSKCMGADPTSQESGAYVLQQTCNDAAQHQHWIIADAPGAPNMLQVVARHNGKALDVAEGKTGDGTQIIVFPAKGASPNQQFKLSLVTGGGAEATAAAKSGAGGSGETAAVGAGGAGGKAAKGKKGKPAAAAAKP